MTLTLEQTLENPIDLAAESFSLAVKKIAVQYDELIAQFPESYSNITPGRSTSQLLPIHKQKIENEMVTAAQQAYSTAINLLFDPQTADIIKDKIFNNNDQALYNLNPSQTEANKEGFKELGTLANKLSRIGNANVFSHDLNNVHTITNLTAYTLAARGAKGVELLKSYNNSAIVNNNESAQYLTGTAFERLSYNFQEMPDAKGLKAVISPNSTNFFSRDGTYGNHSHWAVGQPIVAATTNSTDYIRKSIQERGLDANTLAEVQGVELQFRDGKLYSGQIRSQDINLAQDALGVQPTYQTIETSVRRMIQSIDPSMISSKFQGITVAQHPDGSYPLALHSNKHPVGYDMLNHKVKQASLSEVQVRRHDPGAQTQPYQKAS